MTLMIYIYSCEHYRHDENQILEEQCNTPIYDFAMLRKDR